ncbi:MAG: segregation and condensation protein B [Enterobacterales bacterium]|jgi:segregation and condensation protein B
MENNKLKNIIEAILMSAGKPIPAEKLLQHFDEDDPRPSITKLKAQIKELQNECEGRGIELKEVSSGYRYQARDEYGIWVSKLWDERPQRYSRALLETLALVAYRQPVTRSDIEDVRGVGVSTTIIRTLLEREWVRIVGHRDVPGRPALFATTRQFLDYFNMKSLDELPSLSEIKDLSKLDPELDLGIDLEKLEIAFNGPSVGAVSTTDEETTTDEEPKEDIISQNHEEDFESNQLKTQIEE